MYDAAPLVSTDEMPNPAKRFLYRRLNRLAAGRAKRIIAPSRAAGQELVKTIHADEKKLSIIPLAAYSGLAPASSEDVQRVRALLDLPLNYTLYLGINKPHKNLVRLVRAWAQVRSQEPMVIAGPWDPRYPDAKQETEKLGQDRRVLFRHNINDADLPALLTGARAFVFPSYHEGFGLPVLEAMACGTPVACSNVSAMPEVVGPAAVLFNPFDSSDMAAAIERLLTSANLRWELKNKGLQQAQQFSWDRTACETFQVYEAARDAG
jgi:alpha-1,3-rhamnosyl/mannosyltransferase